MRDEAAGDRTADLSRSASAPRLLKLPTPDFLSGGPSPVPGPEGETLDQLIEGACRKFATRDAVLTADGTTVTYAELDGRANRLSRHLIEAGVRPGDRVGVLLDRSDNTYVTLLAIVKAKAGYVPLDVSFPVDRLRFIVGDAGLRTIVSTSRFQEKLDQVPAQAVLIDVAAREIAVRSPHPISVEEAAPSSDKLCYIIYTSGTTGTPKGVMIEHPSICSFVRVAAHLYGFRPGDRVYGRASGTTTTSATTSITRRTGAPAPTFSSAPR
jgi:non-ribosomal peptide synthetase component F